MGDEIGELMSILHETQKSFSCPQFTLSQQTVWVECMQVRYNLQLSCGGGLCRKRKAHMHVHMACFATNEQTLLILSCAAVIVGCNVD